MKPLTDHAPGIPPSGAVLKYLIRAVGLPTKAIPGINDQDLHRLSSGELSAAATQALVSKLFDHLLQADQDQPREADLLKTAHQRYVVGAPFAERWILPSDRLRRRAPHRLPTVGPGNG